MQGDLICIPDAALHTVLAGKSDSVKYIAVLQEFLMLRVLQYKKN